MPKRRKETSIMAKKQETKAQNSLHTIYGARLSKDEKRVNISIVCGEDDNKQWGTISIKLGNTTTKTKATIKDGYAYIKVPMLEEKAKEEVSEEEIPF